MIFHPLPFSIIFVKVKFLSSIRSLFASSLSFTFLIFCLFYLIFQTTTKDATKTIRQFRSKVSRGRHFQNHLEEGKIASGEKQASRKTSKQQKNVDDRGSRPKLVCKSETGFRRQKNDLEFLSTVLIIHWITKVQVSSVKLHEKKRKYFYCSIAISR